MNTTVTPTSVQIPWSVAVKLARTQLASELIENHEMTPSQARARVDLAIEVYDPLINQIIVEAVVKDDQRRSLETANHLITLYNDELREAVKDYPNETGTLEALIEMYEDSLCWDTEGRTFGGWVELMKRYFYNTGNLKVDTVGKLATTADSLFKVDLLPFFETKCGNEPRDRVVIATKIAFYKDSLKRLKEQQ